MRLLNYQSFSWNFSSTYSDLYFLMSYFLNHFSASLILCTCYPFYLCFFLCAVEARTLPYTLAIVAVRLFLGLKRTLIALLLQLITSILSLVTFQRLHSQIGWRVIIVDKTNIATIQVSLPSHKIQFDLSSAILVCFMLSSLNRREWWYFFKWALYRWGGFRHSGMLI